MAMICERLGLAYWSVPKVACTTPKNCLHEPETGTRFVPGKTGKSIHDLYRSGPVGAARQPPLDLTAPDYAPLSPYYVPPGAPGAAPARVEKTESV